ncbi:MAG: NDP-sugar synthase, partial [Thermoplasmata archaeon]|nr:NDP-sugar synthase [Thermoplasmata archaeon]
KDFITFAEDKGGVGSISLYPSSHPEDYGVVELGDGQRIVRFVEKPSPEEAFSNLINAGAYYLDPKILDLMEPAKFVSMEREVFPQIIDDGFFGYEFEGYWVDVGKMDTYLEAIRTLLQVHGSRFIGESDIGEQVKVEEPVCVGPGSIMRDGVLGPNSSLGKGCRIEGASIGNSVLFDGVTVGRGVEITDSVLGMNVKIEDNCIIKGCVMADGTTIGEGQELSNEKVGMR